MIPDRRIQEIDFGELEGTCFKDEQGRVIDENMRLFFERPQDYVRPKGGESIGDVLNRTADFWKEITTDPALQEKTILVSTHGCAARALLQNVYQNPQDFWHGCVPPNCSINLVEVVNGTAKLIEEDKVYA